MGMYNYAKFRAPGPTARGAKFKKKERGNCFPLYWIVYFKMRLQFD
jgi:hypothetical protein